MRTITLLVASFLMLGNFAKASTTNVATRSNFSFDEPISFIERGIEFFVFPNGEFDFNTRPDDSQGSYYFKGTASKNTDRPQNYGVLIEHDSFGRIRRIGNTFVNYDTRDRVSRIGSIFMRYNRFALTQIGGLTLVYDRHGNFIDSYGCIKRNSGFTANYYNQNYNTNTYYGSSSNFNNGSYHYKDNGRNAEKEKERK